MVDLTPEVLARKLKQASDGVHREVLSAMKKAALDVEATAKEYCTPGSSPYDPMIFKTKVDDEGDYRSGAPFDIGNLRRSMYSEVRDSNEEIHGYVGNTADYAVYVHEGTSKLQARPFLKDAVTAKQSDTHKRLEEATSKGMLDALL